MITEIGCNQCGTTAKVTEARGWQKIKPYPGDDRHELHVCPKCAPSFAHDYDTTTTVKGHLRKLYDEDPEHRGAPLTLALFDGNSERESTIVLFGTEFVVRAFRLRQDDEDDDMTASDPEHQKDLDAILALANWDGGCQITSIAQTTGAGVNPDSVDINYVLCLVPAARC